LEKEIRTVGRESDDRKSLEKSRMRWLLKTCSKTLCNFALLGQTVSINLKFNGISVVFSERRQYFQKYVLRLLLILVNQLSIWHFTFALTSLR